MDALTRRNALRAGGLALLAGVAGCSADAPSGSSGTTTRPCDEDAATWTHDLGGPVGLPPALADGTLYVGRKDGRLVALDPNSGDERWSVDAGIGFTGFTGASPTVADGRVYVVPGEGAGTAGRGFELVALDAETGDREWSKSLDETSFLTFFGVHDGLALVATHDDALANEGERLAAIDHATGDVQWTAEVGDPSGWGVGAGGVYVASYAGVRAIALADGEPRWQKSDGVAGGFDVTANTVVTSVERDTGYRLTGFDPESGSVRWRGPDWSAASHATTDDGVVYAGGERIGAYSADSGAERWTVRGGGLVAAPPIDGRLFARLQSGIHARDPGSGDLLWGTNATLDSPLALSPSLVSYVASSDDPAVPPTLVARHAADGEPALSVTFDDASSLTTPVLADGTVYAATDTGRVTAFQP